MPIEIVKERNSKFDKKDWSYVLKQKNKAFGFIFLSEKNYTLGWDGKIDFSKLEDIALQKVKSLFSLEVPVKTIAIKPNVKSYIGYSSKDKSGLLEFDYNKKTQSELLMYDFLLKNSNIINFARYDIDSGNFNYTFTAENNENADVKKSGYSEITIKQPYSQSFTSSLFNWILETHRDSKRLQDINVEEVTKQIKDIVRI